MKKEEFDNSEFMGIFYFTNWTDEDYIHLWNNVEYTFPKKSSVPMIMPKETPESVQEIRKLFAYDLSIREFYRGKEYKKMSKMGNGLPPTFDEKSLEPMIEKCLTPLPISKAKVKENVVKERGYKASKAIDENDNPNYIFKDDNVDGNIRKLGKMADKIIS